MPANRILKGDLTTAIRAYGNSIGTIHNQQDCEEFHGFLRYFDHHDEFYTETNLASQKITRSRGIQKWLGYPDVKKNEVEEIDYLLPHIHPFIRDWYKAFTDAAMLVFAQQQFNTLKYRFVISIPVQKKNGQFVLIKQMCMPYGRDKDDRVVSFLNSFTIFGVYRREPLKLEVYKVNEPLEEGIYTAIEKLIFPLIQFKVTSRNSLTDKHYLIFDSIRTLKKEGKDLTDQVIANLYNEKRQEPIDPDTIARYLREIRDKLKWILHFDLTPVEEKEKYRKDLLPQYNDNHMIIDFCEQCGIINLLRPYYLPGAVQA